MLAICGLSYVTDVILMGLFESVKKSIKSKYEEEKKARASKRDFEKKVKGEVLKAKNKAYLKESVKLATTNGKKEARTRFGPKPKLKPSVELIDPLGLSKAPKKKPKKIQSGLEGLDWMRDL